MELNKYIEFVTSTAMYPGVNESVVYPALGLVGEASELIKAQVTNFKGLLTNLDVGKEIGDVYWYVVRCALECGLDAESILSAPRQFVVIETLSELRTTFLVAVGECAEATKKMMRDDAKASMCSIFDKNLRIIVGCLKDFEYLHAQEDKVLQMNYDKIMSRKERGVIQGSGDNR